MVHHGVHRVLEFQNLPMNLNRNFLGEVALGHRRRHVGDVSHLVGEVVGHQVDVVGEVFPDSGDPFDSGLTSQLTLSAHFPRYSRYLVGEGVQLSHHPVADLGRSQELPPERPAFLVGQNALGKIPFGHRTDNPGDLLSRPGQVGDQLVYRLHALRPISLGSAEREAFGDFTLNSNRLTDIFQFSGKMLVALDQGVESECHFTFHSGQVHGQTGREISLLGSPQGG